MENDQSDYEDAATRFRVNLARSRNLVSPIGMVPRIDVEGVDLRSDMIRSGILLAHAAMEDLLRSLVEIRLPEADAKHLRHIPLLDMKDALQPKYDLGDLLVHRSKTVDDLIRKSVVAYLGRVSYNNVEQIALALNHMSVPRTLLSAYGAELAALMSRRHHIAHRADRGIEGHRVLPIDHLTVVAWIDAIEAFGEAVLGAFGTGPVEEPLQ